MGSKRPASACESILQYDVKRNYLISLFQALQWSLGSIIHGSANPPDSGAAAALLVCPHLKSTLPICKSAEQINDKCFYASLSVCTCMMSLFCTVYLYQSDPLGSLVFRRFVNVFLILCLYCLHLQSTKYVHNSMFSLS